MEQEDDCLIAKLRDAKLDGIVDLHEHDLGGMFNALHTLLKGGTCISARYKQTLFARSSRKRSSLNGLTGTETLILASIGAGFGKHEIAKEMRVAASTVLTHRKSIMRKLGVRREAELVVHAFRLGLVKASPHGVHRPGFEVALSARNRSRGGIVLARIRKTPAS
ncbi:MAG: LuxR C-terminal-related transcriptional regulator [Opitutaceae bacterium]